MMKATQNYIINEWGKRSFTLFHKKAEAEGIIL